MMRRPGSLLVALLFGVLALEAGTEAKASMTLEFAITPMVAPLSGSLSQDASGIIVGTNLAVTSVSSVETSKVVSVSKLLDFQSGGTIGSNFFILDGAVPGQAGSTPTAFTSPAGTTTLLALPTGGYLFSMAISNGYVSNDLASQFGITGGFGWTGNLALTIASFNSSLGSNQVSAGILTLTSPNVSPSVVPEPSSIALAGMGLVIVAARFRSVAVRSKK